MKITVILITALIATSCSMSWSSKGVDATTNSIIDSLPAQQLAELGVEAIEMREYVDTVPAASCPGTIYELKLYNFRGALDGVYEANLTYIGAEDGLNTSFKNSGRWSTVKGIPSDSSAIVYRFVDFESGAVTLNLLYNKSSLSFLSKELEPIESTLNYTLPLKEINN